jgi:predicted PurR-regulated permease PerM
VMVISFYLLMDFNLIRPTLLSLAPLPYRDDANFLLNETNHIWRAFLRGQVFLGIVIGVIVSAAMLIVGLDFPIVLGLIAGLLELVPMFGPVISALVAVLVALFQPFNPFMLTPFAYALLIVAIFTIIQQLENTILVPRIMGESLNLRPLVVFMAVLAGGALAGIVGILLASPFVATLRLYLSYIYSKVVDKPGRPAPALEPRVRRGRFLQARTSLSSLARRLRERSTDEHASDE